MSKQKLSGGWTWYNIGGMPQAFSSFEMAQKVAEELRVKGYETNVMSAKQEEYALRGYYGIIKRKVRV